MKINKKLRILDFQEISIFALILSFLCTDHTLIRGCNIVVIFILTIWKCISVFLSESYVQKMKTFCEKYKKNLFVIYIGINAMLIVCITILSCFGGFGAVFFSYGPEWKAWFGLVLYIVGLLSVIPLAAYMIYYIITYVKKKKTERDAIPQLTIPFTGGILLLYLYNSYILPQFIHNSITNWCGSMVALYSIDARESFVHFFFALIFGFCFLDFVKRIFGKSIHTHILYVVITLYILITWGNSLRNLIDLVDYLGLTFFRFLALWGLLGGFFIYVLYLLTIYKQEIFRPCMILCAGVCLYLLLAFSFPDYWIARENLQNIEERALEITELAYYPDYHHLISLSADAAPVLIPYMKENGYDISFENLEENYQAVVKEYHYGRDWDTFGYDYMYQLSGRYQAGGIFKLNVSLYQAMKSIQE